MGQIKAVLFDAGNTLIFPDYHLIQAVLAAHGVAIAAERLFQLDCRLRDEYNRRAATDEPVDDRWDHYWERLLSCAGASEAVIDRLMLELIEYNNQGRFWTNVLDGTRQTLTSLTESGRILGVVSNSEGRLETFIEQVGLRPFFQFVLDSELVGVRKPDPEIFWWALHLAQVPPHEALFVGDVYPIDIVGARRVGMEAVLFNPLVSGDGYDCQTINQLSDVILILQRRS